jgi:hypothetical protein
MVCNPFDLKLTSVTFGHFIYYIIMAAIFAWYRLTSKYGSRIANLIPVIASLLGCVVVLTLDVTVGVLNGRVMGVYDSDEWQLYLHLVVFVFVYSVYALIIFIGWNKIVNIIKKQSKH